ncbi:hypothetical protein [Desulforamulus ferrireducens]|uniref:Uncharacterized protein n=1 Tax=Desulforamulus ferrireducens TaxID=1833852 RepID=A0A1S6IYL5_9FIRM|nr:hypothetical protein [Desulforamulus ferrireducens]AQS59875.1 hypothetical protein B0537_12745 [Desulforamulus ferrireducens]
MFYEGQFTEEKERKCGGFAPQKGSACPQLPGTLIRVFIPAGAAINLGLVEIASPSGICLIVRIPLLGGLDNNFGGLMDSLRKAGAKVEVVS